MKHCFNCKFWQFQDGGTGTCHRYPPRAGMSFTCAWPVTKANEVCGEHIARQQKEKHNGKSE